MTEPGDGGFFIGYLNAVPRAAALRSLLAGALLLALFATLGIGLGRMGDATAAGVEFGESEAQVSGVIVLRPYPLLLSPPDAAHAAGRAILLAGDGKRGAQDLKEGASVAISGLMLKRGSLDMLVLGQAVTASGAPYLPPKREKQGRWRVSGEMCDGKCAAGLMHPGTGLSHKACANLCLAGGLPPVLAMREPLLGANFLLLADADGGPIPDAAHDLTAVPLELEGEIEQVGDMLVLRADWLKARAL